MNDVRCYKMRAGEEDIVLYQNEGFEGWKTLSRAIELKFGIDFQLENIGTICQAAGIPEVKISASSFQPRFTSAEQKSVLPLVMVSLQNTLTTHPDLLDLQRAEIYRQQLQILADDPSYVVDFVKNYCIVAKK